jgi:hypothetical protein
MMAQQQSTIRGDDREVEELQRREVVARFERK